MTAQDLRAIWLKGYMFPVLECIREIERDLSPEKRAFLRLLPNGHVWDELHAKQDK